MNARRYSLHLNVRDFFVLFLVLFVAQKNVLFSDFSRLFHLSTNVSLCTLIKKHTLNRTNNHGQRHTHTQKASKKRICPGISSNKSKIQVDELEKRRNGLKRRRERDTKMMCDRVKTIG